MLKFHGETYNLRLTIMLHPQKITVNARINSPSIFIKNHFFMSRRILINLPYSLRPKKIRQVFSMFESREEEKIHILWKANAHLTNLNPML